MAKPTTAERRAWGLKGYYKRQAQLEEMRKQAERTEREYFASRGLEPPGPPETGVIDLKRALGKKQQP